MKILLINKFLYPKGGDAISTINTGALLKAHGHEVAFWGMSHPENPPYEYDTTFMPYVNYGKPQGLREKLTTAVNILYSIEAKKRIGKLLAAFKPDIVHLNNFAHQISPSILDVFAQYNIPSVMTMRDYKMVCPIYTLTYNGKLCEKCRNGRYYHCLLKKCTKGSSFKSAVNSTEMYLHHGVLHIYDKIDTFIAPSLYIKLAVERMGFKNHVVHIPNFIDVEDYIPRFEGDGSFCYTGRLSEEKGLFTLLEAVKGLGVELKLMGDGPLREQLESRSKNDKMSKVTFWGHLNKEELKKTVAQCLALILPSECNENNPRSVLEAFALGKPAIGSRTGGIPELVKDHETGLTYEMGNAADLRKKIKYFIDNRNAVIHMGKAARVFVEREYNSARHYERLMQVYKDAISKAAAR